MMPKPTPEQVAKAIADSKRMHAEYEEEQGVNLQDNEVFEESDVWDDIEMPSWDEPPKQEKQESLDQLLRRWEREQYEKFHPKDGKPPPKGNGSGNGKWMGGFGHAAEEPGEQERKPNPFPTIDVADVIHDEVPPLEYLDGHGLWPIGYCHNFLGDGGMGKTFVMLHKAFAMQTNSPFLGLPIRQGPVLFYTAEERVPIILRRLQTIAEAEGVELKAIMRGFHIIDQTKEAAHLFRVDRKTGGLVRTENYWRLCDTLAVRKPLSLIIDNRARILWGGHNDTDIATEVVSSLDRLSEEFKMSIDLIGHPSLSQINSGRGDSGAVGWSNAGRVRSYFRHSDEEWKVGDKDHGGRQLVTMKRSHGQAGLVLDFIWEMGCFRCTYKPPRGDEAIGRDSKAERVFISMLRAYALRGTVSWCADDTRRYAPTVFFNDRMNKKSREGMSKSELEQAMLALLHRGVLRKATAKKSGREINVLEEVPLNS